MKHLKIFESFKSESIRDKFGHYIIDIEDLGCDVTMFEVDDGLIIHGTVKKDDKNIDDIKSEFEILSDRLEEHDLIPIKFIYTGEDTPLCTIYIKCYTEESLSNLYNINSKFIKEFTGYEFKYINNSYQMCIPPINTPIFTISGNKIRFSNNVVLNYLRRHQNNGKIINIITTLNKCLRDKFNFEGEWLEFINSDF